MYQHLQITQVNMAMEDVYFLFSLPQVFLCFECLGFYLKIVVCVYFFDNLSFLFCFNYSVYLEFGFMSFPNIWNLMAGLNLIIMHS